MAQHVVFEFNGTPYAIAAEAVQTTFWLPRLSPVEGLPPYFVGLVNLHGEVIPVIDLAQRFGHPPRSYRLDQSAILLERGSYRVGLVTDRVDDLVEIPPESVAPYVELSGDDPLAGPPVIGGTVKLDDRVLILLDAAALLQLVMQVPEAPAPAADPADRFARLSAADLALLQQRTRQLAQPPEVQVQKDHPYALVRIGASRYAIPLDCVAEFAHLDQCMPIPCCPPHIKGCMNLRGAILVILDLMALLSGQASRDDRSIVVLSLGDQRLGLAVHEVLDIRTFAARDLAPLTGQAHGHPYCKCLVPSEGGVAGILDFDALLQQGLLDVNDQV